MIWKKEKNSLHTHEVYKKYVVCLINLQLFFLASQ